MLSDLFLKPEAGPLKQIWMRLFEGLGRITYDNADEIYTLYGGNKRMEITFGAPADRITNSAMTTASAPATIVRIAPERRSCARPD